MFFGKLFAKDYQKHLEKGERYFAEQRYADARHEYQEALNKLPDASHEDAAKIDSRLLETGKVLALMNIAEAEHAAARFEFDKASEHLDLAEELSGERSVRDEVNRLRDILSREAGPRSTEMPVRPCAGCGKETPPVSGHSAGPDFLPDRERFDLLLQTLPAGLQERYAGLGDHFMAGYLKIHGEDVASGLEIFRELLTEDVNDILLYEVALAHFRSGNLNECERLLRKAFAVNELNPLCCMGLVQLLADSGRLEETLPILGHMVDNRLLVDQALVFLGDVHHLLGDEQAALESYTSALEFPDASRAAAERLIALFEKEGRREDAANLAKRFLKGCH